MVRIVWPHHPFYRRKVPLADYWQDSGDRSFVIELPDGSHTRIPSAWADDGEEPLPLITEPSRTTRLSVSTIRHLVALLARLRDVSDQ
jgi:hypothetical protein